MTLRAAAFAAGLPRLARPAFAQTPGIDAGHCGAGPALGEPHALKPCPILREIG